MTTRAARAPAMAAPADAGGAGGLRLRRAPRADGARAAAAPPPTTAQRDPARQVASRSAYTKSTARLTNHPPLAGARARAWPPIPGIRIKPGSIDPGRCGSDQCALRPRAARLVHARGAVRSRSARGRARSRARRRAPAQRVLCGRDQRGTSAPPRASCACSRAAAARARVRVTLRERRRALQLERVDRAARHRPALAVARRVRLELGLRASELLRVLRSSSALACASASSAPPRCALRKRSAACADSVPTHARLSR